MRLQVTETNNLLSYAIQTAPNPIQVSPQAGNPSMAAIEIIVSNTTENPIYCRRIAFSFTVGDLAQNLTASTTGVHVSASPSAQWQIASSSGGIFTATPTKPQYRQITKEGLIFRIYNIQVNRQIGTFTFAIQESASPKDRDFEERENRYQLAKFPPGFHVSNFTAQAPQVLDGQRTTLTWAGSDLAAYTIRWESQAVDVTRVRTWQTPPLTRDTSFILEATAQSLGQSASVYLHTTVTVANPELIATSLTVRQATALQGNTTIGKEGATANLTIKGALSTEGTVRATGQTTLGDLTTLGNLTIVGALQQIGPVGILGLDSGFSLGRWYRALTDGLVIASIKGFSPADKRCMGTIYGQREGGYQVWATAGNINGWIFAQSFTLPIRKGQSFTVFYRGDRDNEVFPDYNWRWFPLGFGYLTDAKEAVTLEEIDGEPV